MTQYINKDAVVAELKRRIQESIDAGGAIRGVYLSERMKEDSYILSFIDTLEVKEVDLSLKDIRLIAEIGEEFMNSEESDAYANDEEAYYTAILNKLKEKGLNYRTQRQKIRDIQAQKGE